MFLFGLFKKSIFLCKHLINASQFTITPFFHEVQRQEIYHPFIFLSTEESIQNPSSNSKVLFVLCILTSTKIILFFCLDNVLNNITNLMNNDESTQFTIVNSTSVDDDGQTMQLFKNYKLSIKNCRGTRKY
jgi:hypothetical protein